MTQASFMGSCLCGAVRFEVTGEPKRFFHCHCTRCRKASGTGHTSNLFVQPATLKWIKGEDAVRAFKVPEAKRFTNCFCGNCGGRMPRQAPGTDVVMIPAGSLDGEPPITPQARIFWDSRARWSCSGDALPVYAEYAPQ
ncbi:MAG: GFA family protein [Betaproteobacteria bacterium]|nr:GFA family protein [Betaproteobacteria bacterium]